MITILIYCESTYLLNDLVDTRAKVTVYKDDKVTDAIINYPLQPLHKHYI